jgi:hypothetical protein
MQFHFVIDRTTGATHVRGRDGRLYTSADIEAAQLRADGGDEAAEAELHNMTVGDSEADPHEVMEQLMHDCAECRALRARGETPIIFDAETMRGARGVFRRRPRWRHLKRIARR